MVVAVLVKSCITYYMREKAAGVQFLQDEPSKSIVEADPSLIPDYSGKDVIELKGNIPCFTIYDQDHISGESFSDLDSLGRCGVAYAKIDRNMMPTEKRGEIGSIKPSGWKQAKYPGIVDAEPPYLYNRSHLIAYSMTGENANEKNLITGTRYIIFHSSAEKQVPIEMISLFAGAKGKVDFKETEDEIQLHESLIKHQDR